MEAAFTRGFRVLWFRVPGLGFGLLGCLMFSEAFTSLLLTYPRLARDGVLI